MGGQTKSCWDINSRAPKSPPDPPPHKLTDYLCPHVQHQALQLHKAASGGSERKRVFTQRRGKPFISLLCDNLGLHCGEQFYFILCLAALWHSIIFSSWIQLPLGTVDEWLAQLPSVDFLWIFTICFLDLMPLYVEKENH